MTMKLIDKCPPVTSLSQRKKCEKARTPLERVFAPPSTSLTSKLVYWNKFCALCHGEREIKLHFWKIAFTQSCNISIFYVPSWEEVLEIVKSDFKTCLMGHIPPSMDGQELPLDNLVTKCSLNFNDTDIMKGCSSMYNLKYRNYKNIFCAMCVPFEENDDTSVISSCNPQSSSYLGMSKSEFYILEKRCNNSGIYPLTYPYQNVFCYLCNMRVSQRPRGNANIVYYADIKADVGEVISFEKINAYNIYFQKIKLGDFEWTEDYIRDVVMKVDFNIFKDHDAATALNMTRLAKLFVATTTDCPGLDTDSGLNNDLQVIRPCENNTRCLFGRADYCCLEMFVKTPVSCIPSGSEDKSYLVINDCIVEKFNPRDRRDRSKDFAQKHLCRKEINFPIEFDGKSYKNIFCFLCTEGKWNIQTANLWSFALKCPKEIPLLYYVDGVPNIMKEARSRRCDVIFDTSSAYECLTGITKCSYHGEQDVVTACQDTALQYYGRGRELCETCRHPPISALRKSNCRLGSIHYTKELQRKCEEFPQVNSYKLGIYKNRFCFECNGLTESPKHCEPPKRGSTYSEFATLENVMQSVLSGSPKRLKSDEVGPICYPGRVWSGRRCEALLNHMTRGIYVLQMMLDILVERPTDDDLYEQLKEITSEINAHLSVVLGIDNLVVNLFPVGVQKKPNDDYIVKTILRIIHPGGDYNRDEYERKLLSIGNSLEEFTSDNSQTMKEFTIIKITETLSFSLNDVSIEFLPDIVKYLRGVKDFYEQISPPVNFVSELLFCEHKVIRESYLYDDKSMSIKLQSGLSIPVGLFIRWNGNIQ
ncbi:uncharacterized protein LOC134240588, partial [Saccostrea cucullata]|uniref:uncharacterized protein LOC134240588 n=1 Tax=Saccostrea cuccullata TaxID=36930 RepID=UPI002ED376E2